MKTLKGGFMFMSRWKENYLADLVNHSVLLEQKIKERLEEEFNKGFDTRDEMREVFLEIADEFNVAPNIVWGIYYDGDW